MSGNPPASRSGSGVADHPLVSPVVQPVTRRAKDFPVARRVVAPVVISMVNLQHARLDAPRAALTRSDAELMRESRALCRLTRSRPAFGRGKPSVRTGRTAHAAVLLPARGAVVEILTAPDAWLWVPGFTQRARSPLWALWDAGARAVGDLAALVADDKRLPTACAVACARALVPLVQTAATLRAKSLLAVGGERFAADFAGSVGLHG